MESFFSPAWRIVFPVFLIIFLFLSLLFLILFWVKKEKHCRNYFSIVRDRLQISLFMISEFKQIN